MKGSAEEKASGAEGKRWEDCILTWGAARNMLPLIRRIIRDIQDCRKQYTQLLKEKTLLDGVRTKLSWRERKRRYETQEDVVNLERQIADARGELDRLGVVLLSESEGEV